MLGQVGENFAVQFYFGFFQFVDQPAVGNIVVSGSGADSDLPKAAEIPFFLPAVGKLKRPGVQKRLFGLAVFGFAGPHKALGVL